MRINELPIVRTPDTCLNLENIQGKVYEFPVVILRLRNGELTWRGEGQLLPSKAMFVAAAKIVFAGSDHERDEWPLEINPVAVDLNDSSHYFGMQAEWEKLPFVQHDINWNANGHGRLVAAQFIRDDE